MKNNIMLLTLLAFINMILFMSCDDDNKEAIPPSNMEGKCVVQFNLNYDKPTEEIPEIVVDKGCTLPLDTKPIPSRYGYRFAGWYTSEKSTPNEEWLFGYKMGSLYPSSILDSMAVNNSMTLYARWVSPTYINNAEELSAMRNDLKGWYVLKKDIDLSSSEDWVPIGEYEGTYEYADGEWWLKAFTGKFDGQGHSISNLNLTSDNKQMKALFGVVVNGEISNVIINKCKISLTTPSAYVAPLVGLLKEDENRTALIKNCRATNAELDVNFNFTAGTFSSVTGLVAGIWNGTLEDCEAEGKMKLSINGSGNGELYIGGIAGEAYCNTKQCKSTLNIDIIANVSDELKIFIGGIQASATNISNCLSVGSINFTGSSGVKELYIGGIVGSERYGIIQNNASQGNITVNNTPRAQVGGILGEFSQTYGMIGAAFGIQQTVLRNCYASGIITTNSTDHLALGGISAAGEPGPLEAWGSSMSYLLRNCAYVSLHESPLVDENIDLIYKFNNLIELTGTSIQSILDSENGVGNWAYNTSLPVPISKN